MGYAGGNVDAGPGSSDIAYASGTASQGWAGSDPALQYTGSSDTAGATGGSAATTAGVAEAYHGNNLSASAGPGQTVINNDGVIGAGSQSVIGTIDGINSGSIGVAVSPAGPEAGDVYVPGFGVADLQVINPETNTVTTIDVGESPSGVAVNPTDGDIYVTSYDSNTVSEINPETNAVTTITIPYGAGDTDGSTTAVAVSPTGSDVYVVGTVLNTTPPEDYEGMLWVINPNNNTVVDSINLGDTSINPAPTVAVSPTDGDVYVTNAYSDTVSEINPTTNTVTTIDVGEYPTGVAVSPTDGDVYVTNLGSDTVSEINPTANTVTTIDVGTDPEGVAVSPAGADAGDVYVANTDSDTVSVINPTANTVTTIDVGTDPQGVAVSPTGADIYVTNSYSNSVSVIGTG